MSRGDERFDAWPDGVSTLRQYLEALWRRKWFALAPIVVLPLVALYASTRQQELHEVSAHVLVGRQEVATTTLVGQTPALDSADRTMSTNATLARVPAVVDNTLAAAGVAGLSQETFRANSSVFPSDDILTFTVSNRDPATAAELASTYASEFVRYRRQLDTAGLARTLSTLREQLADLEPSSPLFVRLADREQQLEALRTLRVSNISVVRTATADDASQVAPRPRRDAALALVAGLVLGLVLVFLAEALGTRPRDRREYEALLGMPLLASVRPLQSGEPELLDWPLGLEADAAHTLRTGLELAGVGRDARTIMITSPRSTDGRSSTAVQLATAFARSGRRVVLVDVDPRRSLVTRLLGVDRDPGVADVVRGECELDEVLVALPLGPTPGRGSSSRTNGRWLSEGLCEVIGPGAPIGHPAELLSSDAFGSLVAELGQRSDVVLVDVSPMLEAPDAAALACHADGLVLVVSERDAHGPTLADARRALESWPVAKLGFVLAQAGSRGYDLRRRLLGTASAPIESREQERVA